VTKRRQNEPQPATEDLRVAPLQERVRAKLVVVDGANAGEERLLDHEVVIGTDPSCNLVLDDRAVSRRHTELVTRGSHVHLRDLDSRNGTLVGGTRVMEADVPIGTVVKVGHTTLAIHFAWQIRELAPASARRFGELYGESVQIRETFAILDQVSRSDTTVLIEGETGTGKELAARSVHHASGRARKPFVVFDCTSVPRDLAESELFGHMKGAFSGATADRKGAFERADGGTIFLDELGELDLDLQPKLLRVLESGEIRRVGGAKTIPVDVRVVAATNRDLHAEVHRKNFRSDLLYRLDVVKVRMPPLRSRPEDLEGLVTHLLMGKLPAGDVVEGDNLHRLMGYSWPGNVRELRNVLDRAVTLARRPDGRFAPFSELVFNLGPSAAEPATLGISFPGVASPQPFKDAKQRLLLTFERAYVDALLARHDGNLTRAAAAAELSRKHLYELIRRTRGDTS
jgi:transcriptional regulator with GAF, ATPase, and Fis domain